MFRNFSAVVLLMLMVVAVATAQRGMRYCLYQKSLFIGSCECSTVVDFPESDSCEAGGCCEEEKEEAGPESIESLGSCYVELFLDIGDYLHVSGDLNEIAEPEGKAGHGGAGEPIVLEADSCGVVYQERAPPDLWANDGSVPIYVRHGVFLI